MVVLSITTTTHHHGAYIGKTVLCMSFDYTQYFRGCFLLPSILLLCFLAYLTVIGVWIGRLLRKENKSKLLKERIISTVLSVVLIGFFCLMKIGHLCNGGIHLIREKEASAVQTIGVIEEIEYMNRFQFPSKLESEFKTDETYGVRFVIDGEQYYAIAKGSLKVGDNVEIEFLPQSRYVLSIRKTDI